MKTIRGAALIGGKTYTTELEVPDDYPVNAQQEQQATDGLRRQLALAAEQDGCRVPWFDVALGDQPAEKKPKKTRRKKAED